MALRTPITLVSGPLGSGKTTFLRHLLESLSSKIALLMNEFGEIPIDSRILEGKSVSIAELEGGCVCCSLLGEFEFAVAEILDTVHPQLIVVETTGVAEPDALAFDIQESLPRVRLDGVVTVMDAASMLQFPEMGRTTRVQLEAADVILLNKIDLASPPQLEKLESQLKAVSDQAPVIRTKRCRVDSDLVFGFRGERRIQPPQRLHQPDYESFTYRTRSVLHRDRFERFAQQLSPSVHRSKGFVRLEGAPFLFNFVGGRWELEPFQEESTVLVFIGRKLSANKERILSALKQCE
ncbi:MAG: CobW family GTP-binding protein, partial [Acidobacteriota bacterium]